MDRKMNFVTIHALDCPNTTSSFYIVFMMRVEIPHERMHHL